MKHELMCSIDVLDPDTTLYMHAASVLIKDRLSSMKRQNTSEYVHAGLEFESLIAKLETAEQNGSLPTPYMTYRAVSFLHTAFMSRSEQKAFISLRSRTFTLAINLIRSLFPTGIWPRPTMKISLSTSVAREISNAEAEEICCTALVDLLSRVLLKITRVPDVLLQKSFSGPVIALAEDTCLEQAFIKGVLSSLHQAIKSIDLGVAGPAEIEASCERLSRYLGLLACLLYNLQPTELALQVILGALDPMLTLISFTQPEAGDRDPTAFDAAICSTAKCLTNASYRNKACQEHLQNKGVMHQLQQAVLCEKLQPQTKLWLLQGYLSCFFDTDVIVDTDTVLNLVKNVADACKADPSESQVMLARWTFLGKVASALMLKLGCVADSWRELLPIYSDSCFDRLADYARNKKNIDAPLALWPMSQASADADAIAAHMFQMAAVCLPFLEAWTQRYWCGNEDDNIPALTLDRLCLAGISPPFACRLLRSEDVEVIENNFVCYVKDLLLDLLVGLKQRKIRQNGQLEYTLKEQYLEWLKELEECPSEEEIDAWLMCYICECTDMQRDLPVRGDVATIVDDALASGESRSVTMNVNSEGGDEPIEVRVLRIPREELSDVESVQLLLLKEGCTSMPARGRKLFFHNCYGHKAIEILRTGDLRGASCTGLHDIGKGGAFYLFESYSDAADHRGGAQVTRKQALPADNGKCVLIFEVPEAGMYDFPHIGPADLPLEEWKCLVFSSRNAINKNSAIRRSEQMGLAKVIQSFRNYPWSNKVKSESNSSRELYSLLDASLEHIDSFAWVFTWMATHTNLLQTIEPRCRQLQQGSSEEEEEEEEEEEQEEETDAADDKEKGNTEDAVESGDKETTQPKLFPWKLLPPPTVTLDLTSHGSWGSQLPAHIHKKSTEPCMNVAIGQLVLNCSVPDHRSMLDWFLRHLRAVVLMPLDPARTAIDDGYEDPYSNSRRDMRDRSKNIARRKLDKEKSRSNKTRRKGWL